MDPFEIRPESGMGRRWPIRWRLGTRVEGGTRFGPLLLFLGRNGQKRELPVGSWPERGGQKYEGSKHSIWANVIGQHHLPPATFHPFSAVHRPGPPVLDVLTPMSDCRKEPVEKMERRISGVWYMCWMDFHNRILCCGFLCARLISVYFVCLLSSLFSFPATTPRATTPHLYCTGYHAQGYHAFTTTARLPRLCIYIPATTP